MSYFRIRDILTRNSFLNAIVIITVLGGSTNAVCLALKDYLSFHSFPLSL